MTAFSLDNSGDARLAIQEIYRDYGPAGIDDEALVTRLLPDLLPDSPREASLLKSAAGAKVGRLLSDRLGAMMPWDAAVRDVAAILVDRLAFDAKACLWVVNEYARAMGHAVDVDPDAAPTGPAVTPAPAAATTAVTPAPTAATPAPANRPGDVEPTHMDPNLNAARYAPGRAGPVYQPTRNDVSGVVGIRQRQSRVPLIVGIIVIVGIVSAIGIGFALRPAAKCKGSLCLAGVTTSPTNTTPPPTHPPSPSTGPSTGPSDVELPGLADIMPLDLVVDSDCTTDNTTFLDNLSDYYACKEADGTTMHGMNVWGYQFATKTDYLAGVQQFNDEVDFSPAHAGTACPPPSSGSGNVTWHRNDAVNRVLGHLECYYSGDHENKDYAWTDDTEFTIMVAEATSSQTFTQLATWWGKFNNNSSDA